jgi:protein ImuA
VIVTLHDLRARIARIEGFSPDRQARVCPTGWAAIDAALPGGGLLEGALHEIHSPDPADGAAMGFAARLIGRFQARAPGQAVLWSSCRADLFAPGLHAKGVDPARLIIARCRDSDELLSTFEEGLKSKALSAVFGEIGELDFALSRRLQLAAAETGTTLVLLRPARFGGEPSAAVTRWRAVSTPGGWALTLFRCRNGRPGHWPMSANVGESR